jgi:hypothetical protein
MEKNSDKQDRVEAFREASIQSIRTTPPEIPRKVDAITRTASVGLLAGLVDYVAGPAIFHTDRAGQNDEVSALLIIVGGMFLANIQNIRALCATEPENIAKSRWNLVTGGAGGAVTFAGLAKLVTVAALSGWTGVGALAAGGLIVGVGGSAVYNRISRKKYCPHIDCGAKGNCKQRVCRRCLRLFWPKDQKLDCSATQFLDWYSVASYLQTSFMLSYMDAVKLLEKYFGEWFVEKTEGKSVVVDCSRFVSWIDKNKPVIANYKGAGKESMTKEQIREYLQREEL